MGVWKTRTPQGDGNSYRGARGGLGAGSISLLTDRDVEDARPMRGSDGTVLRLVLVTTWDGAEPSGARIAGVFGREFESPGRDPETAMLRAIVLRSGRLPVPVKSVVIEHPGGKEP